MSSPEPDSPAEIDRSQADRSQLNPSQQSQPQSQTTRSKSDGSTRQAGPEPIPQSCTDLRAEIERKIRANGVPRFSLKVLPTLEAESLVALAGERTNDAEIVGSCDAGSYRIIYRRG